jgi:tetratricopeptide (TPR) repeat protein
MKKNKASQLQGTEQQISKKTQEKQQLILAENNKRLRLYFSLFLAIFALLIYYNAIGNEYALDDFSVIKENNIVKNGSKSIPLIFQSSYRFGYLNVNDGLYRPFTLAMYAIEWQIFPDKPSVYHFINVLMYMLTGAVMFRLLCKLLQPINLIIPLVASLLFIAHPIHTEVVANIKSSDEIVCFLFVLLAIHSTINYLENNKIISLLASLFYYTIALFSKESAILLLALLPLSIFIFRKIPLSKIITVTSWMLIPTVIYLIARHHVLGSVKGIQEVAVVDNLLMAAKTIPERIATAFVVLGMYLKLLIFPHPLLYNYSFNQIPIVNFSDVFALSSLLIHLSALAFALVTIFKKKFNTENIFEGKRVIAYGILFYLISIFLFSNLVLVIGAAMGERFVYFSSFGFCIIVAVLLAQVFKIKVTEPLSKPSDIFQNKIFISCVALICLAFSLKTIARNPVWKDNLTLYRADLPISMNSVRSHYYLGNELIKRQNELSGEAIDTAAILEGCKELQAALKIYPLYNDAYTQLGVAYYKIKDYNNAEKYYLTTLDNNPNDAVAISNLAAIYFNTARYQQAIEMYGRAIELNPRFSDAMVNMGSCYGAMQKFPESIEWFMKAIEISPDNAKAYYFTAKSYDFMGDKAQAASYMAQAKSIDSSLK